jgi:hypothetical protein
LNRHLFPPPHISRYRFILSYWPAQFLGDIILISTGIVASKDLLTSIFNLLTSIIELIAKRDHVQEIEVIIGGKTFIFRDLSKKTAKELIENLAAQHPEVTRALTLGMQIQAKAKVSKKRRARN